MEKNTVQLPRHTLMLDGRARAKLTGVTAVSCFNDREVVLETGEGEVALLGENLHIEQLNLDDGQLDVTGGDRGRRIRARRPRERRGAGCSAARRGDAAAQQAQALGWMAALGAAAGHCYDLLGRAAARPAFAGAADLFLGALCAAGMTGIALRLRMNPFRLYAFAGVALGLAAYAATLGRLLRFFAARSARLRANPRDCVKKVK